MDNFYARHAFSEKLEKLTEGEAMAIGTVNFTNVDGTNWIGIKAGLEAMKNSNRGKWCIVPVFDDINNNLEQLKCQHQNRMKTLPKTDRTPFEYQKWNHMKELACIVHAVVSRLGKGPKSPSKYVENMEDFKLKCFDESKKNNIK